VINPSGYSITGDLYSFDIDNCVLSANRVYALVLTDLDGSNSSRIDVGFNYGGTYSDGMWVKSINGGSTWSTTPDADMGFEIWGKLK